MGRSPFSKGLTCSSLVEQGLRLALQARKADAPFKLQEASFKGRGLQPGVQDLEWEAVRKMACDKRML